MEAKKTGNYGGKKDRKLWSKKLIPLILTSYHLQHIGEEDFKDRKIECITHQQNYGGNLKLMV
jgi:hypothetical protein